MTTLINIDRELWFQETPQGGTLNLQTVAAQTPLQFQVGISFASLMQLSRRISLPHVQWTIRDCSLTLLGDQEELRLHFCSLDGSNHTVDHILRGRELRLFCYAVHALASRHSASFN